MELAKRLVRELSRRGFSCATAESCTGGGVGKAITSAAGASAVYLGGVVSYANDAKRDILGVPAEILAEKGAVSRECASAMASGARRLFKADIAVSTTGIAGPGGGSAQKPVGLVWFAVASRRGVRAGKAVFKGGRAAVRTAAVAHALELLLDETGKK